jgi:hypothetical protein
MFDVNRYQDAVWPDHLRPVNEGEWNKEAFENWWERFGGELGHIHPKICEQWIHRHWTHSPWSFLALPSLTWEVRNYSAADILGELHREFGGELNVEFDYKTFQRNGYDKHHTAQALDQGTWDYPIVTLSTPSGITTLDGDFPNVRLVLVEGHQRHRYLNALFHKGVATGPHEVFVLSTPQVST